MRNPVCRTQRSNEDGAKAARTVILRGNFAQQRSKHFGVEKIATATQWPHALNLSEYKHLNRL
jgi:hypothetical protein